MIILSIILLLSMLSFHSQAACPLQLPYDDNGVCTKCPTGTSLDVYAATPTCVSSCPSSSPMTDSATGWCSPCPDETPVVQTSIVGGTTVYTCIACSAGAYDIYTDSCVVTCPNGDTPSGTVCPSYPGSKCPTSNAQYYDVLAGFCVSSCPKHSEANATKDCVSCPTGRLRWNDTTPDPQMKCLVECPFDKPDFITDNNVCNPCVAPNIYWDNSTLKCVKNCSLSNPATPANNSYNWCATCRQAASVDYWDPVNETCVIECPATLPTWNVNFTCTSCDPSTPFWLSEARTCVDVCPDWAISWNQYNVCKNCTLEKPKWDAGLKQCTECPTTEPYWNNLTQTCVKFCNESDPNIPSFDSYKWCKSCSVVTDGYNPYWNNTIHDCADSCPDTAPSINGSNWCLPCSNPQPVWIDYLGRCNETCPIQMPDTDTIGWCVPCDYTTPWYNSTSEQCEACVDPTPFYNPDTYSCVAVCPVGKPDHNASNWCQACIYPDSYWDNSATQDCTATCPRATPFIDTNFWCQQCTGSTSYYNKTSKTCISVCEPPLPIIGADNWCDPCPNTTPYWDPTLGTPGCVATCSPSVPLVDYRNVCTNCGTQYWDPVAKTCVPTCPSIRPLFNSSKVCQVCPGTTKWNPLSSSCVEVCPVTIPFVNSIKWCSTCLSGHYNSPTATCVNPCPNATPAFDANNWCQPCPNEDPKWVSTGTGTGFCAPTCPVSKPKTGQDNWCEACPSPNHWDPITSSCVVTCLVPKPYVNTDNWCDGCPNATPFWLAGTPSDCVASCPRQTPLVDSNKQCQSCQSDTPNFDSDASKCVATCPPKKPVVGADNWCETCPSSNPYWFSGNNTCLVFCPPIAPSIDDNNWCQECSGATLKWNPLTSTCVSQCPESLPFWNSNAIPRACEVGPDIGNIVNYLNGAGLTSTITLAGMQIAMPGIPYVALTILLINVLKYLRYLDINFPPKTMKMFQTDSLNIPSLNFGPLFPESWKLDSFSHPAPERFARYDISGLFIANFWRGLTTALIMTFGVTVMKLILRKKIDNEKVVQVRDKAKVFLLWNYIFSFFISNIGNIVLFIFVEYRSLALHDVMGTLSFLLTIVFSQISLVAVTYMIKCIKKVHTAKKKAVKEINPEANESFKVLLLKYKDENLQQMLFIPIMCIRASLNAIFVAAIHAPVVQCSLLVVMNIIMIAYHIKNRPHREIVDNMQLILFEITLLIADCACLHLATLPWAEQVEAETAGTVITVCNVIMFTLSLLFILTRIIVAAVRLFKEKFAPKRPGTAVYVQTDVTGTAGTESVASTSQQLERKESKKENRLLSMSFESSAEFNVGNEEDQSPTMKDAANFNKNNLGTFHVVKIPDDENEQMSKYFETET